MEDEELVVLCRDGDGEAFAILLERHQAALYSLAYRLLGDREEALDAMQDACLKAWRAIGTMRGGVFRSWMNSIVARTCLDRLRARRPQLSIDDDDPGRVIPLPDLRPGPEAAAVSHERVREIELAISKLSPEHRAIVLLRDLSGMSYEEIATSLQVPLGTVRSRLARARAALQAELLRLDPNILEAEA
jgi:RNA polymerase sigma-70 factor (ECF subfamily)